MPAFCRQWKNPRLISRALFTSFITSSGNSPIFSLSLVLSMVRICSSSTTLSLGRQYFSLGSSMCVGSFAFVSREVVAAAITVGLYLLPISFCKTKTGEYRPVRCPQRGLNPHNTVLLFLSRCSLPFEKPTLLIYIMKKRVF